MRTQGRLESSALISCTCEFLTRQAPDKYSNSVNEADHGISPEGGPGQVESKANHTACSTRAFQRRGEDLFRLTCKLDLEGNVAWKRGAYVEGERTSWVKIKNREYSQIVGRDKLFEKRADK